MFHGERVKNLDKTEISKKLGADVPIFLEQKSGFASGVGEVFEKENVIGKTTLTQVSIGFQLGGQAFSQIIFFKDEKSLERFTEGNFEFGASASAALISEVANATADYSDGVAVLTYSKGGLMYEASIGGQKFSYEEY